MGDYLENTPGRPRQLKIFIASLASMVVDVADYLENTTRRSGNMEDIRC